MILFQMRRTPNQTPKKEGKTSSEYNKDIKIIMLLNKYCFF